MATKKALDFEQALAELETLVEALEHGELSLEDSLKRFERGIELSRTCQGALAAAEQRVEILQGAPGQEQALPFAPQD